MSTYQEPVVIKMPVPQAPGPVQKIPKFGWLKSLSGARSTKIITAVAAIVISITMLSTVVFSVLANDKSFQTKHSLDTLPKPVVASKNTAALPGGGKATGVGACTGTNCPAVTITADPATVNVGGSATINWSVVNNPKSCEASDDWSGTKASSGSEKTKTLSEARDYLFTLTCKTATGTGFAAVKVSTVSRSGGSGSVAARPTVSLGAYPLGSVLTGQTKTLRWEATNNPTSCVASGDWSGVKPVSGSENTLVLASSSRVYNFSLQCSNSSGTSELTTIHISPIDPPPGLPEVVLSATPVGSVLPGGKLTLSWTASNNPTSCTASGDWSGAKAASGTYTTPALTTIGYSAYSYTLSCTNTTGSLDATYGVDVLPNLPAVSFSATGSTNPLLVGGSGTLSWSVSNVTPGTSCTGGGVDWPGSTTATLTNGSGSRSTGTLSTAKTYTYSITCKNETGTAATITKTLTVSLPPPPVVSISVSPISISTNQSATITWSAPTATSCTPSGDLTGPITPATGGSKSTGTLTTARTYTYTLQCSNAGGQSNIATTTLSVGSGAPASSPPVVTLSITPTSISTGSAATVSWSATNSPTSCTAGGTTTNWVTSPTASMTVSTGTISTAGTRTYSITCTNSAGSGTGSGTLNVVALPTVSVSLAATSITTGSSTTYSWSSTGATSCSGAGALSGAKATSGGPVTTGAQATAGTFNYTITCVNSIGGSASSTAVLTVTNAAAVYCSNNTPCFGPNQLATHNTVTNCYGYNNGRVVNVTNLNSGYHKAQQGNLLPNATICGNVNLAPYISGGASISGIGSHNHGSAPKNNTGIIASYLVGYYDVNQP